MFQFLILAIIAVLVSLDQASKWLAVLFLKNGESVTLIPNVLSLEYVENRGAAFGILQGQRWLFVVFTGAVMAAILALLLFGRFRKSRLFNISATLIVAGGIGNFIDRLIHGYVVDFIKVEFFDFPVFNVADCFVVIGSVLLLIFFFFFYDDKKLTRKSDAEDADGNGLSDHSN